MSNNTARPRVALIEVFEWLCPTCSRVNRAGLEAVAPDEEIVRLVHGLEPWQEIPGGLGVEVFAMPHTGACPCGCVVDLDPPSHFGEMPSDG